MSLDTRGFMDGALRGFDTVSRIQDRQEAREQQKADRAENNRRWQASHDEQVKQATQAQDNWNKNFELQQQSQQDQSNYRKEMLGLSYADKKLKQEMHDFTIAKAKKDAFYRDQQQFINNNAALLDKAWISNMDTGAVDPLFESPFVKGTQWDATRYDDKTVKAYRNVELNLPDVIQGRSPIDKSMLEDVTTVFKGDLLRDIKGSMDATGTKTIEDLEINGLHMAADINPELAGAQPGLVFNLGLTYKDKDGNISKGDAPLTEARSTSKHDAVKIIPVEKAMQYLSQGMKLSRAVNKSKYYNQIFHPDAAKRNQELEKEYRQYLGKVELGRSKAIAAALKGAMGGVLTEKQMAVINKPFDEQLANAQGLYAAYGLNSPIGNGKQEVSTLSPEDLFKIKGDLVGHDSLKSTQFEPFVKWVSAQGVNVAYALKDKDTAKILFESYLKTMKDKTVEDNFNYAVAEGEKRRGGTTKGNSAVEQIYRGLTTPPALRSVTQLVNDNNGALQQQFAQGLSGKSTPQFSNDVLSSEPVQEAFDSLRRIDQQLRDNDRYSRELLGNKVRKVGRRLANQAREEYKSGVNDAISSSYPRQSY